MKKYHNKMKFWQFSYTFGHYLTHPFLWLRDFYLAIKYAWQRAITGYDDKFAWDIPVVLNWLMPELIYHLKNAWGYPIGFKDEYEWQKVLDKISRAFANSERFRDLSKRDADYKSQKKEFDEGMRLFVKHYFSLWD